MRRNSQYKRVISFCKIHEKVYFWYFAIDPLFSCAHTVYKSQNWQKTKVTADGWSIEWPDELWFIDEKTKISYDMTIPDKVGHSFRSKVGQ